MDGEVDLARDDRLAQCRHEDALSAERGQRSRLVAVALGGDGDQLDVDAGLLPQAVGDVLRLRGGQCAGAGTQAERHSTSPPTRVTASTAAGSSAKRSVSASA